MCLKTYHTANYKAAKKLSRNPECSCCGEATPELLLVDSIAMGKRRHVAEYIKMIELGKAKILGIKVVCHNCNYGIRKYGVCPHKSKPREVKK